MSDLAKVKQMQAQNGKSRPVYEASRICVHINTVFQFTWMPWKRCRMWSFIERVWHFILNEYSYNLQLNDVHIKYRYDLYIIYHFYRFRWLSLVGCLHDGWFDSDHQGSTRTSRCAWSARCCVEPKKRPNRRCRILGEDAIWAYFSTGWEKKHHQDWLLPLFALDVFRCCVILL